MTNLETPSIKQVRQSKQNTLELLKQPPILNHTTFESITNIPAKLSIIKRMYETKKHHLKRQILLQWPNEQIKKVIEGLELVVLRNNAYYIGEIANNVIHGKGVAVYSEQRFYEGQFQNNYKHGHGIECLPTGIYMGGYVNNKPEGKGTFVSKDGDKYEGEFRAGMKHGKGIWVSNKHSYNGEWRGNKPNGFGRIKTSESEYEGMVSDGLKHGQGKEIFANGDVYSGEYYNGRPQGQGVYIWDKTGSVYKGEFKNGLRHGKGVWKENGDVYTGQFSNDKKNGRGHFVWASGNQYEGMFFEDVMHGEGCMRWVDGSWYKGNWLYGVQNGYGQTQQKGEPIKKGIFENNCLIMQEDFSIQSISRKVKLQRLSYRRQKEKKEQKSKQAQQVETKKQRYAHQLEEFQTESEYSKKVLPSHNNSLVFRPNKSFHRRRVLSLKSQELKKSIQHHKSYSRGKTQSFSDGEEVRLIDWRRMRALKPL